jgi:hypothetical protein
VVPLSTPKRISDHPLHSLCEYTHFKEKNTLEPTGSIAAQTLYFLSKKIIILGGLSRERVLIRSMKTFDIQELLLNGT